MPPPSTSSGGITTVLFDLDGTLVDTEPAAALAVRGCFDDWQVPISDEDTRFITGRTWKSAFDHLFARYPIPVPPHEASQLMIGRYRAELETHLHIVPGAAEAVVSLSGFYRLALVSGSYRSEILWALRKLGVENHFSTILGAEDYPRSKPAPDGYAKAMSQLGVSPSECVVFEDSEAGIASGLAAGARVIAISSTNHFRQDTSGAHHQIPDLRPVTVEWLKALSRKWLD